MIKLPEDFVTSLKEQFPEKADAVIKAICEGKDHHALRLRGSLAKDERSLSDSTHMLRESGMILKDEVPFFKGAFYYDEEKCFPGKHPFHDAGVYYIQEPSAMLPASLLDIKPGEKVLDLCAAPGGKSTQAASYLKGEGLLVSNEPHRERCKILSGNIERMGIKNAVVLNETPERLSGIFSTYFDKIIVDAPCSGEGMFRKNPEAVSEWSMENVKMCALRQESILNEASGMLKPGGYLVYSTCTFSKEEDEDVTMRFLASHPDYELVTTKRLFPGEFNGEGHFAALLKRQGERMLPEGSEKTYKDNRKKRNDKGALSPQILKIVKETLGDIVNEDVLDDIMDKLSGKRGRIYGDNLYLLPEGFDDMLISSLKWLRPGLHIGTFKKERFEPSHAFVLSLEKGEIKNAIDIPAGDERIIRYLRGESLNTDMSGKGWKVLTYEGNPVGLLKQAGNVLKNHYPKGLRKF